MQKLRIISTVAVVALALMSPKAYSQTAVSPLSQQLSGSWIGELELPGFPQLRVFMVYSTDGSILATSSNSPLLESHQVGAWVRTGDRTFTLTVLGFVFDESGRYSAIRKIKATISLTPALDEFSGDGSADLLDPSGAVFASIPSLKVHGKRIVVELPTPPVTAPAK